MTYEIVDVIPDTPEWKEERRKSLGASEVPAVLGLSPWDDDTALAVYESKLGVDRDFDPELAFIGHALEPVMEDWLKKFRPLDVPATRPGFMARSVEHPWLHASFDRVADHAGVLAPVQMKTAHAWAREWKDGAPLGVQAQVQAEIAVLDAPHGWALGFVGGRQFHLHRIERDQEWIDDYLIPITRTFWHDHVLAKRPPEIRSAGEHARAWTTAPGKAVELTDTLAEALDRRDVLLSDARELERQAKTLRDEADATQVAVLNYAEDAQFITRAGTPRYQITPRSRRNASVALIEEKHPELLPDLVTVSRWTVLQAIKEKK